MKHYEANVHVDHPAVLRTEDKGSLFRLIATGDWVISETPRLDSELKALRVTTARDIEIDGSGITLLDSAGAWLLLRTKHVFEEGGRNIKSFSIPEHYSPLIELI